MKAQILKRYNPMSTCRELIETKNVRLFPTNKGA